jgi:hypothetical protein
VLHGRSLMRRPVAEGPQRWPTSARTFRERE